MIVSFRDEWLRAFFVEDTRSRHIPSDIESRLFRNLAGFHSIRVNSQWRLIFRWNGRRGEAEAIYSATTASFISVENRRRRATPVITSTFENVSDIGVCLGLSLGPPAKAGVRSKQGAVQPTT